jgi:hypothetical protein
VFAHGIGSALCTAIIDIFFGFQTFHDGTLFHFGTFQLFQTCQQGKGSLGTGSGLQNSSEKVRIKSNYSKVLKKEARK